MMVKLTPEKKLQLFSSLKDVIGSANHYVPLKHLAAVVGRATSCEPVLGPITQVLLRRAYCLLQEQVDHKGWSVNIKVSIEVASDLEILKNRVDNIDGYPIRTEATAISVVAIVGLPSEFIKTKVIPQHIKHNNVAIWCGDASAMAVCAYSCSGAEKFHFIGQLTKDERKTSSGQRELLTVKYALTKWLSEKSMTKETTTMYWLTDSENLFTFLTRGSRKLQIQEIVLDVLDLCRELNLANYAYPSWQRRSKNQDCRCWLQSS